MFYLLSILSTVWSHIEMIEPAPRFSKHNKAYSEIDYDMNAPLGTNEGFNYEYPCRTTKTFKSGLNFPIYKSYKAGSSIEVILSGTAYHNGGNCEFSLSYDGLTFITIHRVLGNCLMEGKRSYNIPLPIGTPAGKKVTFAWSWVNRSGNREFYMNCADIEILNPNSQSLSGTKMVVANLPGYPIIPEEGFESGNKLYEQAEILTYTPSPNNYIPSSSYKSSMSASSMPHSSVYSSKFDANKSKSDVRPTVSYKDPITPSSSVKSKVNSIPLSSVYSSGFEASRSRSDIKPTSSYKNSIIHSSIHYSSIYSSGFSSKSRLDLRPTYKNPIISSSTTKSEFSLPLHSSIYSSAISSNSTVISMTKSSSYVHRSTFHKTDKVSKTTGYKETQIMSSLVPTSSSPGCSSILSFSTIRQSWSLDTKSSYTPSITSGGIPVKPTQSHERIERNRSIDLPKKSPQGIKLSCSKEGFMHCLGEDIFLTCNHGYYVPRKCAPGTICMSYSVEGAILCA